MTDTTTPGAGAAEAPREVTDAVTDDEATDSEVIDAEATDDEATRGPVRTFLQGEQVPDPGPITEMAGRGRALRITEIGEDVLHRRCQPVTEFGTDELATLIDDMFATMLVAEGVGLAANQVGVDAQVFVYDLTDAAGVRHLGHVLNPEIEVLLGDETEEMTEGCLSVPGPGADLFRPYHVRLRGVDLHGAPLEHEATGYLARCFQHETGHLHGQLYTDLLAKRVRRQVLAEMLDLRDEVIARRTEVANHLHKEPAHYPAQGAWERARS